MSHAGSLQCNIVTVHAKILPLVFNKLVDVKREATAGA